MHITTIGLDLAKNIFQVHGVTEDGSVAFNKPLRCPAPILCTSLI